MKTQEHLGTVMPMLHSQVPFVVLAGLPTSWMDPKQVCVVRGHHNWIAVAYPHFVCCYRLVCIMRRMCRDAVDSFIQYPFPAKMALVHLQFLSNDFLSNNHEKEIS
jgi:hypothetical protein